MAPFGGLDRDAILLDGDRLRWTIDAFNRGSLELLIVLGLQPQGLVRRDQGHVGGVAPQKQGFGHPVAAAADYADALVGDLIPVADRTIADETARQRLVMKLLVHRRA